MRNADIGFEIRGVEKMWTLKDLTHGQEVGVFAKIQQAKTAGESLCDLNRPAALIIIEQGKQADRRFYP